MRSEVLAGFILETPFGTRMDGSYPRNMHPKMTERSIGHRGEA